MAVAGRVVELKGTKRRRQQGRNTASRGGHQSTRQAQARDGVSGRSAPARRMAWHWHGGTVHGSGAGGPRVAVARASTPRPRDGDGRGGVGGVFSRVSGLVLASEGSVWRWVWGV